MSKIAPVNVIDFCHIIPGSEHDASLLAKLPKHIRMIAPNLLDHNSNKDSLLAQIVV